MMMRGLLPLLFAFTSIVCRAQGNADPYVHEADRYFQQMAYARAIEGYTTATELGAVNEHVTKRLAECYIR